MVAAAAATTTTTTPTYIESYATCCRRVHIYIYVYITLVRVYEIIRVPEIRSGGCKYVRI